MRRSTLCKEKRAKSYVVCVLMIMSFMLFITTSYADAGSILVSAEKNSNSVNIITEQSTIDIPIVAQALQDVYAFEIAMTYAPDKVSVESIAMGDIFSDYGSAVVQNTIDNDVGQVKFMQTILSAEKGMDDGGVLCVIRIAFEDGIFDAADDLGLAVKIANSTPEYITAYITPCTITVDTQAVGGTQPTPTIEPAPTATIGVIAPDPQSEQAEDFVVAEDASTDEIIAAAAEYETTSENAGDDAEDTVSDGAQTAAELPDPMATSPNNTLYWIIGAAVAVVVIAGIVWLLVRRKQRVTGEQKREEK